ncbi:MCE family protein [Tateyamaria omphalii]|uniref:PqiB family protein n=1 Tax=Tateyamaria omphalii TaxID=299262 RepID=UPI001C993280|nr:MlaD family protein [Tateyamaria omphalii]MBY5934728.1 MCE family protein [Tateyamaria omphalii]
MSSDIPDIPQNGNDRRGIFAGAHWVWLVPVAAVLTAVWVALQTYNDQGPLVQITFDDAAGILPGETELRFRNVSVGIVEDVQFNDDLSRVLVDVRLDKTVAPFVDGEAAFWIVRPQVTTSGVTGLETVLSGVYIEGTWDSVPGGLVSEHQANERAPLITTFQQGTVIELRSTRAAGLSENTPILFKGIEVGRLGKPAISVNGQWVSAPAIIYDPHDQLVTTATRFWDTSGFSLSVGASGASLDFSSLASLISGGITFGTLVSGGEPLRAGLVYEVHPDEAAARNSVFEGSSGALVRLTMIFDDNVSGLTADAAVEWRGLRIGRVANVSGIVAPETFGDSRVRLLSTVEINTSRFGVDANLSRTEALEFLEERVAEGLRARLVTASLLAGGLKVELITDPDAPPADINRDGDPFPVFPVTESEVSDVALSAEGVLERVNALPVEELLDSAIRFLNNASALVASEEIRETPTEILGLLSDARGVIGSDEVQALPEDLRLLMADLQAASGDLRGLLADVRDAQAVDRLLAAVDQVGLAAARADTALAEVPELTDRIAAFVDGANALPLEDLVTQATGFAREAQSLLSSDDIRAAPGAVTQAFAELSAVLNDLTEADTAEQLSAALTDASAAATAVENAVAGLPSVVERLDRIAAGAEEVELDTLAAELEGVLATARRLFGDASDADLPDALAGALTEAEAALAALRNGGLIDSANATMSSAREAAAAVESAADELPALANRLNSTLTQAQSTLRGYEEGSAFSRETLRALNEIERAAKALSDLARTIQRNPNSLILGR